MMECGIMKKLGNVILIIMVCLSMVLLAMACSNVGGSIKKPKIVTFGEINGNAYNNNYFGLAFTFPEDWEKVWTIDDLTKYAKLSNEVDLSEEIDLGELDWLQLFFATKNDPVQTRGLTSNILVTAEKIESLDKFDTVEKYLENNLVDFKEAFNDIKSKKMGSKEVKYTESTMKPDDGFYTKAYACETNGYIVIILAGDYNGETTEDIEKFINSISFK